MEENLYKTAVLTMDVEDWYHLDTLKTINDKIKHVSMV